jgi:hydroxymethylpyrimidine/phosphomethylpyrimidine kinase
MRTAIDAAGRVALPAAVLEKLGFVPGMELELRALDGRLELSRPSRVRVEAGPRGQRFVAEDPEPLKDEQVRALVDSLRERPAVDRVLLSSLAVPHRGRIPVCLSIAGSDSGGGAGIQADLKAFARAGVHGTTAITAVTAQNTVAVTAVEAVSPAMIVAQVRAVVDDIGVDAVKVGMLGSVASARAVGEAFDLLAPGTPIVVDPVMVAESGSRLLDEDAQAALVELVVARATVVTPNLPEARVLAGNDSLEGEELARAVHALGPDAVVVTGGHREEAIDIVFDGTRVIELAGPRYADGAAHGSGCTHSATLAARLALGDGLEAAAREAKRVASEAVRDGLRAIGAGAGPVDVFGLARPH